MQDWRRPIKAPASATRQLGHQAPERGNRFIRNQMGESEVRRPLAFASAADWEALTGQQVGSGAVLLCLDGNSNNLGDANVYCLPKVELSAIIVFTRIPLELRLARLEEEIVALDTSDAVKKELLRVLEQLTDQNTRPDIVRQRAICETVQTLVNLLRVEVAYIRAIDGDAVVPFLEPAHEEALKRKAATKKAIFQGPAPDHPWRGLGSRGQD